MISKWIIKAIVQKSVSYMPGSQKINFFFQKHVTRGVHLTDEHFGQKLHHARDHYKYLLQYSKAQSGLTILELGTGWYPIVPLLFYLTSSGNVISIDIQGWMTRETQRLTILKMKEWRERGLIDDLLPVIDEKRWAQIMDIVRDPLSYDRARINEIIGLTPLLEDARRLKLADNSIDFICSNNTLEHIPEDILRDILPEFRRVLKPDGVMSHFIDMSDHFAHFDPRITIYNFLKYSRKQWKMIDNRIQPQNRMRFRDYKEIFREAGFPVTAEVLQEGNLEELINIRIHPEFSGYTIRELAISHATLISCLVRPGPVIPETAHA
jgi:ubiquinone/menaquinone biosynthesis C-methylase UbiE